MSESKLTNLLDEKDLARILKRKVKTIRKDRLANRGPRFIRVGRQVRYLPEDVAAFLKACPSGGQKKGRR